MSIKLWKVDHAAFVDYRVRARGYSSRGSARTRRTVSCDASLPQAQGALSIVLGGHRFASNRAVFAAIGLARARDTGVRGVHVPSSIMSASATMADAGYLLARGLVAPPLLRSINTLMRARAARVMDALGGRPIGLGSVNGYDELVQRSHNRWDVPMSEADLAGIWGPRGSVAPAVPWLGLVQETLGPTAAPSFCGVVFSDPGSPPQQWHIDSPVR